MTPVPRASVVDAKSNAGIKESIDPVGIVIDAVPFDSQNSLNLRRCSYRKTRTISWRSRRRYRRQPAPQSAFDTPGEARDQRAEHEAGHLRSS